jgi:hypothetical protein
MRLPPAGGVKFRAEKRAREEVEMKITKMMLVVLAAGVSTPAIAQQNPLPSSGTFKIHTGYKGTNLETIQFGDKRVYNSGIFWGVSFNDAGSGPLHLATLVCPLAGETINGAGLAGGVCAWTDTDGDNIFITYNDAKLSGGTLEGINQITGGTGKFKGITGTAPFQCKFLNDKGQAVCYQQFEYKLGKQ